MKKSPASIERNANASAQQARADSAKATENIFHSKQPATENKKENATMKTTETTPARKPRIFSPPQVPCISTLAKIVKNNAFGR